MAEPVAPAADAAAPPKSRKKLLLVVGAAVMLLGGAGAGAWMFLGKTPDEQTAEAGKDGKSSKGKDKDKKKDKKEEAKPKLPAQFVELDPPFVVNFEPGT